MVASRFYVGRIGILAVMILPLVSDTNGFAMSNAEYQSESVLVQSDTAGSASEVVISDSATLQPMEWPNATASCCGTPGCAGHCGRCDSAEGWFNRILGRCHDNCHFWTAQVDALMLWQGNIPSRPLLQDSVGTTVLDANDAQTSMGAGVRYGLLYNLDLCHAIEGNYFSVDGFDGDVRVPSGDYSPVTTPDPPVPTDVQTAQLLTNGQFKSAELNWRWRNNDVLTWLIGFRWVEWNQALGLGGESSSDENFAIVGLTGNDLYGSQIGADLLFWDAGRRFRLNGIGKAGIYGNRAYQRAIGFDDGGVVGPVAASGKHVSFFGEVGMYGDIAITRWLSWRTGYVVFWGTGLALPAENLSLVSFGPPDSAQINVTESLLVHGVTTGLEARW